MKSNHADSSEETARISYRYHVVLSLLRPLAPLLHISFRKVPLECHERRSFLTCVICRDLPSAVDLSTIPWLILQDIDELHSSAGVPVDPLGIVIPRCFDIPSSVLDRRRSCLVWRDLISLNWIY